MVHREAVFPAQALQSLPISQEIDSQVVLTGRDLPQIFD